LTRLHALLPPPEKGPVSLQLAEVLSAQGHPDRARLAAWSAAKEFEAPEDRARALLLVANLALGQNQFTAAYEALVALQSTERSDVDALAGFERLEERWSTQPSTKLTNVRQHIGELAIRLSKFDVARTALELVLAHEEGRQGTVDLLIGVHAQL